MRRWTSWRRWTLLAMTAHALLAVITASERADRPSPAGMITLTCNEVRRLFTISVNNPRRTPTCAHACHSGDDAINTAPGPAATGAKRQPIHGHNDLRLEY